MRRRRMMRILALVVVVALLFMLVPATAYAGGPRDFFRKVGHGLKKIVQAPGRVSTWATKWMGPVVGPLAADYLTGRIIANPKITKIFQRANRAQNVLNDIELVGQAKRDLRAAYSNDAKAYRTEASNLQARIDQMKADGLKPGDIGRLIDIHKMKASFEKLAVQLDNRAAAVSDSDVARLFGSRVIGHLVGNAKRVVANELSQEIARMVDPDILTNMLDGGLDPGMVADMIIERDASRALASRGQGDDAGLRDRLRDSLRDRLREDKDFFRKNWRDELDNMIAEIANEVADVEATERNDDASKDEDDGEGEDSASSSGKDYSNDDEGRDELSALLDIDEDPKDSQWQVWYPDDVGFKPFRINTVAEYEKEWTHNMGEGWGLTDDPVVKVPISPYLNSREEAQEWLKDVISNIRTMEGVYAGMLVCDYNGETHNLEQCGFDPRE